MHRPKYVQLLLKDIFLLSSKQRGANQEPYAASIFVGLIAIILILIGNVNSLAPVVTMPFLMTYAAVNYAYFKLVMCMDLQKRRKLIEEGVLVDDTPKSPKNEETRLVSKAEMMDCLSAKDYGTGIQNGQIVGGNTVPDVTEKSDVGEKENLDKDTLEDNVGVPVDNGVTVDSVGVTVDNVGISMDNSEDDAGDNTSMIVDNRGNEVGGNQGDTNTDVDYCELDVGEETELYNKENEKEGSKKKIGRKSLLVCFALTYTGITCRFSILILPYHIAYQLVV